MAVLPRPKRRTYSAEWRGSPSFSIGWGGWAPPIRLSNEGAEREKIRFNPPSVFAPAPSRQIAELDFLSAVPGREVGIGDFLGQFVDDTDAARNLRSEERRVGKNGVKTSR